MKLWAHQQLAVETARSKQHLALFYDIGTGKTGTMISILREHYNAHQRIARTIIFAPLSVCPQWKKEFLRFSKIDPNKILVLTASGKKRVELFKRAQEAGHDAIVVTNYESVQIKDFYDLLEKWQPEIAICDEGHRLKDSNSKRAKKIYPLTENCSRRFLLTGTPILNSLLDIFGQYRFLDRRILGDGFWSFRARHFYDANAGKKFAFPEWVPFPNAAKDIAAKIAETSLQAKREECLDLPPLQQIRVPIELAPEQKMAYKQMSRDFITQLGGKLCTAEFAMTKTLRMQQILAGFLQPDDAEPKFFEDQPRLDALMDIIESIGDKKAIIWTTFQPTYKQIADRLEKAKLTYAFLTGEETTTQKINNVEAFCRGTTQFLISNPAAGGEGVNLQEAPVAIYYLRGYNLGHYLQSAGRNYRGGSERHSSIIHYQLIAEQTLDEVIAQALFDKKNIGDAVLNWSLTLTDSKGNMGSKE